MENRRKLLLSRALNGMGPQEAQVLGTREYGSDTELSSWASIL